MAKQKLETSSPARANIWQEVNVQGTEALGEEVLFGLGLEARNPAVLWMYKDSTGDLHISRVPRNGIRKIVFRKSEQREN